MSKLIKLVVAVAVLAAASVAAADARDWRGHDGWRGGWYGHSWRGYQGYVYGPGFAWGFGYAPHYARLPAAMPVCASGAAIIGRSAAPGAAGEPMFRACGRLFPVAHVDEVSGNRGSSRHRRRHQMRAALVALTAFEVAV